MDTVRLATPEEIKNLPSGCDLSYATSVVTYGGKDFAVLRNCYEIDPMIFDETTSDKRKLLFGMNLETILRFQNVHEVYFNVAADNESFKHVLETWGATPISATPEIRYKKVL